jgi:hypothetical protein
MVFQRELNHWFHFPRELGLDHLVGLVIHPLEERKGQLMTPELDKPNPTRVLLPIAQQFHLLEHFPSAWALLRITEQVLR